MEVYAISTEAMPEVDREDRVIHIMHVQLKKDFLHARVLKRKVKFSFEVIAPTLIDKKKK